MRQRRRAPSAGGDPNDASNEDDPDSSGNVEQPENTAGNNSSSSAEASSKPISPPILVGLCLVVGIVAVLCYFNSLHGAMVFDDHGIITDNRDVTDNANVPLGDLLVHDYWGKSLWDRKSHKSFRPLAGRV